MQIGYLLQFTVFDLVSESSLCWRSPMSHHGMLTRPFSTGALSHCRLPRDSMCTPKAHKRPLHIRAQAGKEGGDSVVGEDLLAKLKAAEEEAQRLKQELAAAKAQSGEVVVETDAKPQRRIDSGDLKRETLFTTESKQRNWLNESDVNFFTGGGPSEAEESAASSKEEQSTVQRRLLLGLGLTAALGAFALVPTEKLAAPPSKPLFFYIVPLIRVQGLLQEAEAVVPEGNYGQLQAIIARIQNSPNNLQENLRSAAASLPDSRQVSTAEAVAREVYEYVEQIDYNRYFDSMGAPGSRGGKVEQQYYEFSSQACRTAQIKLREFLALMPRDQLEAAQQQVNNSPF